MAAADGAEETVTAHQHERAGFARGGALHVRHRDQHTRLPGLHGGKHVCKAERAQLRVVDG
eukprot:19072-Eustigmatos_ZCMA.PRE.1